MASLDVFRPPGSVEKKDEGDFLCINIMQGVGLFGKDLLINTEFHF